MLTKVPTSNCFDNSCMAQLAKPDYQDRAGTVKMVETMVLTLVLLNRLQSDTKVACLDITMVPVTAGEKWFSGKKQ